MTQPRMSLPLAVICSLVLSRVDGDLVRRGIRVPLFLVDRLHLTDEDCTSTTPFTKEELSPR